MSSEMTTASPAKSHRRRTTPSELKIVLDTSALFITPTSLGSASDLVRQEIDDAIHETKYPDLTVRWFLPEIVRLERQYQMQTEALKLRFPINKIERLLGHNLALTDASLVEHVKRKISEKQSELGLEEIQLDYAAIDWQRIVQAAAFRLPPFEPGDKEKGFRDALVAESFLQILRSSPKTPSVCRVVLLTGDGLLTKAVNEQISQLKNASVVASLEELKGLVNTIVSNVDEAFIALLKPKARRMFFASKDEHALFYREGIKERLMKEFASELQEKPEGTAFRQNGQWTIYPPNFAKKVSRKIFWTSRIEIDAEAGILVDEPSSQPISFALTDPLSTGPTTIGPLGGLEINDSLLSSYRKDLSESLYDPQLTNFMKLSDLPARGFVPAQKRVVRFKAKDVFEVVWSSEVTMSKELKKPIVETLAHIEINWAPVT